MRVSWLQNREAMCHGTKDLCWLLFCQYWCLDQTNVYVLVRIERWYRSWCKRTKNGFVVKLTPAQLSPLVTFRPSNGCFFKYFHRILQQSISYKQVELSTQLFPYGCKKNFMLNIIHVRVLFCPSLTFSNRQDYDRNPEDTHAYFIHRFSASICICPVFRVSFLHCC